MKINKSFLIGLIITILLLGGVLLAFYLSQQTQDVRQRASEPTPTTNAFGKALRFGSTTQDLATSTNLSGPFTVEFWVNPSKLGENDGTKYIISNTAANAETAACNSVFSVYYSEDKDVQTYHPDLFINDVTNFNTGINIPFGQWSHLAFTVATDNNVEFFINGDSVGKQQMTGEPCFAKDIELGGAKVAQTAPSDIDLEELRISQGVTYIDSFTPQADPSTPTNTTLALWHFDNELKEEFSGNITPLVSGFSFVQSTLQGVAYPPVCQATLSTCSWDPVDTAVSYHYKVTENFGGPTHASGEDLVKEGDVQAPATSITFTSEANKTYTCEVTATSACGTGPKGSATATCSIAPTPTSTGVPPTPTATSVPPTPTATSVPPTPTATGVPPTATPVPPTATTVVIPPTATTAPIPTDTPIPGVPTNTPTPTIASPGSPIQTFAIAGGIILTIIGALFLFAL